MGGRSLLEMVVGTQIGVGLRRGAPWALASAVVVLLASPGLASADPQPLGQLGSTGAGAGQLDNTRGVLLDDEERLYVAEDGNARISVFDAAGAFSHAFGYGVRDGTAEFQVCTAMTDCQAGISGGNEAGAFNGPSGLALDGSGMLYVADFGANRISAIDVGGPMPAFSHAFGFDVIPGGTDAFEMCTIGTTCKAGDVGADAGHLRNPRGVALDGSGDLAVVEQSNHRITVIADPGGTPSFTHTFGWDVDGGAGVFQTCTGSPCVAGAFGPGDGQLAFPAYAAIGSNGDLIVSDSNNQRVSVYEDPMGTPAFKHSFGYDVALPDGNASFEVCDAITGCQNGFDPQAPAGEINNPAGVALAADGRAYIGESINERFSSFTDPVGTPAFEQAFGWGVDTGAGAFETCTAITGCQIGSPGGGLGQLEGADDLAVSLAGDVYVSDTANDRVNVYGEPPPDPPLVLGAPPSNAFSFGKLKRNKRKGIAFLFVKVPGPGQLGLAGPGLRPLGLGSAAKALTVVGGTVKLRIAPHKKGKKARKLRKRLKRKGKARVKARVTYVPSGGAANTKVRKLKLVRKAKRK
jgi:DNA-binding beta-propeller fold protein YncE